MGLTSDAPSQVEPLEVTLPAHPSSVATARQAVRDLLVAHGRVDLLDSAVLLVSEIVTNALLHAGTEIRLAATLGDTGLRVEVGDGSPHLPSRRRYATTSGTGRGLLMLEAMVDDWGATRHGRGKTVWFQLSGVERDQDDQVIRRQDRPDDQPGDRPASGSVPVQLNNMPLLLHAAWQEHAEALLREYLLASLTSDSGDPIAMHAEATDAIAVLEEFVPQAPVDMATDALMAVATEPSASAPRVVVSVPAGSVAHFETLDRAIEAALDLSREGLVLTAPTQPEVHAFRRWMCRQVLRQAAGDGPEAWSPPESDRTSINDLEGWDATVVAAAGRGVIAANTASQIIAVSPEAAQLLGYDDPEELLGQRVVSIIPERLRQAHVAGFTMYLLVGRKPLLDRTVILPALRRDGTEVDVELVVRSQSIGEGRTALIAEIRATCPG